MSIRTVGLIVNNSKWEALSFAPEVLAWLTEREVEVRLDPGSAPLLGREDLIFEEADPSGIDLFVTLGGDGTILSASHIAAPHGIPILGVHMGQFGFIAETHPNTLFSHLEEVLEGNLRVEERMMVQGRVFREGEVVHSAVGLNDIVLSRAAASRMPNLHMAFAGESFVTYPADGVVVATPTGSTAYSLSAGGPLVEPTVQALLVVPICAHTLAARPLIVPADEVISFHIETDSGDLLFTADIIRPCPLQVGDRVEVRRAEFSTRIVTLQPTSFYRKIRKRLLWGERLNV